MYYTNTRPTAPPLVSWAQMQSQLRLTTADEQQYVTDLVDAAVSYAEEALDSSLLSRTITVVYDEPNTFDLGSWSMGAWPSNWSRGTRFFLPRGPVAIGAIQSVIDANSQALTFTQDRAGMSDFCLLSPGQAWKAPITIVYTAGYGAAPQNVPADICLAIRAHAATLFENRESVSEGRALMPVPHSLEAFYALRRRTAQVG